MICRTAAMALFAPMDDGWRPTSEGYVDHETAPIRCHWERAADEARCADVMTYVEDTWAHQVDDMGFVPPLLTDEDGVFDVYITNDGTAGGAYVTGPMEDEAEGDGLSGCHAYMALDPTIPDDEMESYVVHEFQHVLQYATDFNEYSLPVWEGVAEAVAWWSLKDEDYAPPWAWGAQFQRDAFIGILGDGYMLDEEYGLYSFYEYGSMLWVLYMDATYGADEGQAAVDLWRGLAQEGSTNEPDVLDAWGELTGGPWQEALLDFSLERAWVGTEAAPAWVGPYTDEGMAVPLADIAEASELPLDLAPEYAPLATGVVYFQLTGLEAGQTVSVEVTEGGEVEWGLVLTDGSAHATVDGASTEFTSESGADLTIGVINFGKVGFDADAPVLRSEAEFLLALDLVGDSGDSADDGGSGDDGAGGGGDDEGKGCGCAGAPLRGSAGLLWLGLAGLALRRRRP